MSGEIHLNVQHPDCHKAADAFWKYWKENGVPHKHGYYESTWGAINAALKLVGVSAPAEFELVQVHEAADYAEVVVRDKNGILVYAGNLEKVPDPRSYYAPGEVDG